MLLMDESALRWLPPSQGGRQRRGGKAPETIVTPGPGTGRRTKGPLSHRPKSLSSFNTKARQRLAAGGAFPKVGRRSGSMIPGRRRAACRIREVSAGMSTLTTPPLLSCPVRSVQEHTDVLGKFVPKRNEMSNTGAHV